MNANSFRSAACEWGCSHKKDALEAYELSMKDLHTHFKVECCGFFVSQMQHYLGGTPDSVVSCDCHGQGVVEVKCPYCARDSSVSIQAKENRRFCLETVENGSIRLKPAHPYYYQCQLQMFVSGWNYCDFVVWTKQSTHVERINIDDNLLSQSLPIAKEFFYKCILPELLGKWYTRQSATRIQSTEERPVDDLDDGTWCLCNEVLGGEMVRCDNESCQTRWYHLVCLKLSVAPQKWLCPTCRRK